jgi:hypothetical protein
MGFGLGLPTSPVYHLSAGGNKGEFRSAQQQTQLLDSWRKPGIWAHIPYTPHMELYVRDRFKATFFIRRDPRDVVVSMAHYLEKYPNSSTDLRFPTSKSSMSQVGWDERLLWLITHMGLTLPHYTGWIRNDVYQVKYEDMIDDRVGEFNRIQAFLETLGLNPPPGERMAEMSRNPHKISFRRGKYGDWQEEFTSSHVEWADKYLGHVIRDWGYT